MLNTSYNISSYRSQGNRHKVILLSDDFNTPIIPEIPLPFVPILNIPLIQVILGNLIKQGLDDVVLCVKTDELKEKICEYLIGEESLLKKFNMCFIVSATVGDCLREIDDRCDDDFYFIVDLCFFTTIDFSFLINQLKKDKTKIMEAFLFPYDSYIKEKRSIFNLSGFITGKNSGTSEIVYYETAVKKNEKIKPVLVNCIQKHKDIIFRSDLVKLGVCAVRKEVMALFTEHFEIHNIDDLIEKILAIDVYAYKFGAIICENSNILKNDVTTKQNKNDKLLNSYKKLLRSPKNLFEINMDILVNEKLRKMILENNPKKKNKEIYENGNIFIENCNSEVTNSCLGKNIKIKDGKTIKNSIIGNNCEINSNVEDCILLTNSKTKIDDDLKNKIVTENKIIDIIDFKEPELEKKDENNLEENEEPDNFFKDINKYLQGSLPDLISRKIDLESVTRQISLIKIIWNASNTDLVEAFATFIGANIDATDYEDKTITVSMYFPSLNGQTKDMEVQKHFMIQINEALKIKSKKIKNNVLLQLAFLLIEDGIVCRDAVYKSKVVKGFNL